MRFNDCQNFGDWKKEQYISHGYMYISIETFQENSRQAAEWIDVYTFMTFILYLLLCPFIGSGGIHNFHSIERRTFYTKIHDVSANICNFGRLLVVPIIFYSCISARFLTTHFQFHLFNVHYVCLYVYIQQKGNMIILEKCQATHPLDFGSSYKLKTTTQR